MATADEVLPLVRAPRATRRHRPPAPPPPTANRRSARNPQVAPLVVPLDTGRTAVEGYLRPPGADAAQPATLWARVSGAPAGGGPLTGARLEAGPALAAALAGREAAAAARLADSPSLAAFFVELQDLLARPAPGAGGSAAAAAAAGPPRAPAFFSGLRAELDAVGWASVSDLASDLSSLTLHAVDAAGRRHALRLTLPRGYPAAAPLAAADLPAPFAPRWGPGAALADALVQFKAALAGHQMLWDSLDDLDAHAWVVEPAAPRRADAHRRLALGGHATLALTLDVSDPGAPPEFRLMGPDAAVAPLRAALAAARPRWRRGTPLRENLEAALGAPLPARPAAGGAAGALGAATQGDAAAECAICYSYRLPAEADGAEIDGAETGGRMDMDGGGDGGAEADDGGAPDVHCDNAACGKPFHALCLAEWLAADAGARRAFGVVYGECPYCSAQISACGEGAL
jgi:E3 ubiquitin-protein ligase FANCL